MQRLSPPLGACLFSLAALAASGCKEPVPEDPTANGGVQAEAAGGGPTISGVVPADVQLPSDIGPNDQVRIRPNFDDFSWRTFIALNWPVAAGQRGVPREPTSAPAFMNAGTSYATVWDSYRTAEDLYVTGRPVTWQGDAATPTPCSATAAGGEPLIKLTKMASSLSDLNQAFSFPLVDQNGKYVRYEIYFNQVQYDALRGTDDPATWLYRLKQRNAAEQKNGYISLPSATSSPYAEGATMVKAAWREMVPADDAKRYYTRQAVIYDTSGAAPVCRNATVGLIGLHIARKLSDFPQWVWSSFEHIDNVPLDDGSLPPGRMSLNNGKPTPATQDGFSQPPPGKLPIANPTPVQVTRVNPIPTTPAKISGLTWPNGAGSTIDLNNAYRAALQGTVWANYQLVITQWPFEAVTPPTPFKPKEAGGVYPQDAGGPFPLYDAVNTALETYLQARGPAVGAGGNSCMQCHYGAGREDFSWSLRRRPK